MSSFFHNLGRKAGGHLTRAKWYYDSLAGEENESVQAEFEMGAFLARDHRAQLHTLPSQEVAAITAKLAERLVNEHWQITTQVVDSQRSEAFALPGGFIFVTQPLVNFCGGHPDRLAFFIGHEMGHIVKRHAIRRLAASKAAGFFNQALAARTPATRMLSPFVGQLVSQGYSEEQEFEADDFAQRLGKAAGYDPNAGIQLMQELIDAEADIPVVSAHLDSHPPLKQRIARMQE